MTNKNIGYIYLIVQSKNISSEMISGIKASILLKETIEIEKGSYLFIKNLNNDKHKNSIVINTIQKIYDLLINKSVKVYIVDNKNNNYSGLSNSNNQIINLDELYNKLDFKYVTKLISKSNRLYFVVSYVDEETKLQNTHIFPTNYVSRELFERNHLLNSYNSSSNIFDLEIQENNKKEDLNTSISEVKQKEKIKVIVIILKNIIKMNVKNVSHYIKLEIN